MTHAELLRSHADLALKEGGMYYSGEYLSRIATVAESLESENARLRELLQSALTSHNKMCTNRGTCAGCLLFKAKPLASVCLITSVTRDARELGVEVNDA